MEYAQAGPALKLERVLTPPGETQYLVHDMRQQSPSWTTPEKCMSPFVMQSRQGDAWNAYRSTSCPAQLPSVMEAQPRLSRHLCVYPGRPVENLEADCEKSVTSAKRRTHRKRENLPRESTAVLRNWLLSHLLMPYPMNDEKLTLCSKTGLDIAQVNNWFINARVRIWKPLVMKIYKEFQGQLQSQAEVRMLVCALLG